MMDHGRSGRAIAAMAAALVIVGSVPAAEGRSQGCGLSAAEVYAQAGASVVQVMSLSINPFLVGGRTSMRSGTGFMVGDGLVLTNYHVVADAVDIAVLTDDKGNAAEVIGIDPALDIALLRPTGEFEVGAPLPFAEPTELSIGQPVYALGFPFGIGKSVSAGIVSGVSRVVPRTTSSWLSPFIQTDAAVSAGNSGGPLLNGCSQVVGLISSRIDAPEAENLAFAIPIEVLAPVVAQLAEKGHVSRPWHGLYGQMVSPPILQMLGVPPWEWENAQGFLVETVEPGSGAERAGLRGGTWPANWGGAEILLGGDIITEVDGVRIDSLDAALGMVRGLKIGQTVRLTALRDGMPLTTSVVLEERPLMEREMELYRWSGPD